MDVMVEQRHPATVVRIAGAVHGGHRVPEMSGFPSILETYGAVDDAVASHGT
jgi:hypothetical protein